MNLLDFFRPRSAPSGTVPTGTPLEEKRSAAYSLHYTNQAPVWSARDYDAFVREAYTQNVIAFQSINKLAVAISSIRWQVVSGGAVLPQHPILDLLGKPNPGQSGVEWWKEFITYLYLNGNAYTERVVERGRVLELWNLRPDRMSVKPSTTGLPAAYIYKHNSSEHSFPSDTITGQSAIYHTRLTNPKDDWLGLSPVNAGAYAIDQHNEAMRWMQALLQNSARPSGALVIPADMNFSDTQFRRLKSEIEAKYAGSENAGRPILLEGGLKWETLGLAPDKMTFIEIKDSAARDISLAFGVPPLLLGIPGDNTYSNYREARLGFYEDTVIPLARLIISGFNDWMSPFLNGALVQPDIDSIEAVAEKRRNMWEMVDSADELTINEARKLKGFPPLTDSVRGEMLLADLRSASRGHEKDKSDEPGI